MTDRGGFSLLEMLVALAVFSLGALALLHLTGEATRSAVRVEERTLAGVVADNRAIEAVIAPTPPVGLSDGVDQLAGRDWAWRREVAATEDPAILRISVQARIDGRLAGERVMFRRSPA